MKESSTPILYRTQSEPKISFLSVMNARAIQLDRLISEFSHYNRIRPNMANSPYHRAMVETIAEVGFRVKIETSAYTRLVKSTLIWKGRITRGTLQIM